MSPPNPNGVETVPDPQIRDERDELEAARPSAVNQDNSQPRQVEQPATTASSEAISEGSRQTAASPAPNAQPTPQLDENNAASNAEAGPAGDSKAERMAARVAQAKIFLQEEDDDFVAHFQNLGEFEEYEEAMELIHQDDGRPDLSAGYPQTDAEFVAHCRILFDAMNNLDDIHDVVGAPGAGGQSSFTSSGDSVGVKFVKSKKRFPKNLVVGKLMRAMLKAQLGQLSVPGAVFHEYENFTLRFQAVVNAAKVSKLVVRSAFESQEWVDRIAINPDFELKRKRMNKGLNDKKDRKRKFADEMKKRDPTINFDNTASRGSATPSTSAATPSPAPQSQQLPGQGTDLQPAEVQAAAPNASPAPRASKRTRVKKEAEEPAQSVPSSVYEGNISRYPQLAEGTAIGQGHQGLHTPLDGSLDVGGSSAPVLGEEAIYRLMGGRPEQMAPASFFPGMIQAPAPPGGGHGTAAPEGQVFLAPGAMLDLDPNPFNVPGPIRQYGRGLYHRDDHGFQDQPPTGPGEIQFQGEGQQGQQNEDEDQDPYHYGG